MKKLFLLIFTGAIIGNAVNAQIQFGVKAGANFATLTGSGADGAKSKVDFHGGALVGIPIISQLSVQPEVLYSGQGAKANFDGEDFTLNQTYLNVPVLVKYTHPAGIFAEVGPQVGFLLSSKVKAGGTSQDVKSSYNSTDFSLAFGLGYLIHPLNAGIDARYNLGLSNIAKDSDNGTIKNSVFQIGVFYLFGGKK